MIFIPVRNPNGRSKRRVLSRTQNKTWGIINNSEIKEGFANVWIKCGKNTHTDFYICVNDINRTNYMNLYSYQKIPNTVKNK